MDYEKKYKEALERARKSYVNSIEQGWTCDKEIYEEIFPELKESEDEKIRKDIIAILKGQIPYIEEDANKKYIAWLEKQGAQKPAWSEEDKERIEQICEDLKCGLENFRSGKNVKVLHFEKIIKSNIDWLKSLKQRIGG